MKLHEIVLNQTLTDEVVRGVTFNTTLRGSGAANSRSAFSLPPRQYGVTLRAQF